MAISTFGATLLQTLASVTDLAIHWWLQSMLVITAGLTAGWLLRGRGPAIRSAVYRTTLLVALICPLVSWLLSAARLVPASLAIPDTRIVVVESLAPAKSDPSFRGTSASDAGDMRSTTNLPDRSLELEPRERLGRDHAAGSTVVSSQLAATERKHVTPALIVRPAAALAVVGFSFVWLFTTSGCLIRLLWSHVQLIKLRRTAVPASEEERRLCMELAAGLGVKPPELLRTPFVASPCLAGITRSAILLPEELSVAPLTSILVHELAHHARRDCLWILLREVAKAVMFFQPLVWWLSRRLETTAEEVCDDYVVQYGADRRAYADMLLQLATRGLVPASIAVVPFVTLRSLLGQRVVRILDCTRRLSLSISLRALTLILALGVGAAVAAGLLGALGRIPAAMPDDAQGPSKAHAVDAPTVRESDGPGTAAAAMDNDPVVIRGQVVDPLGQPIAGADVTVMRFSWNDWHSQLKPVTGKADQAGRFQIEFRKTELQEQAIGPFQWRKSKIVASAPGFAIGWAPYEEFETGNKSVLRLVPAAPFEGRIVNRQGRPIAGVQVRVERIFTELISDPSQKNDWTNLAIALNRGLLRLNHSLSFYNGNELPGTQTQTDADGWFHITNVGAGNLATLRLSGGGIALTALHVINIPDNRTRKVRIGSQERDEMLVGRHFQYAAELSQPIEGVIRDAASGRPLAGVRVLSDKFAGTSLGGVYKLQAVSDAQGRYRLEGMPKGEGNTIVAMPGEDQPYFMREFEVPTAPGVDPVTFDLELHRGIWITGRVTEQQTGKPVRAWVYYLPWPDNPHIEGLPEFNRGHLPGPLDRHQTEVDGTYRLVGLPGRGLVEVDCVDDRPFPQGQGRQIVDLPHDQEFHKISIRLAPHEGFPTKLKEVRIAKSEEQVTADIDLEAGQRLGLRLIDPQGQPLAGATIQGLWPKGHNEADAGPKVEVLALRPDESRLVLLHHPLRNLGQAIRINLQQDGPGPLTVALQPCATVTARLLDKAGEPISGAKIQFSVAGKGAFGIALPDTTTDAQGRFTNTAVLPGCEYTVYCGVGQRESYTVAKSLTVTTGETVDLGEFDVTTDKRPEPRRSGMAAVMPPRNEPAAEVRGDNGHPTGSTETPIAGVVVSAVAGQPLASVKIYAWHPASRESLSRSGSYEKLAETTADGRFQVNLPRQGQASRSYLIAYRDGFGVDWVQLDELAPQTAVALQLSKDVPITGRVVNTEGRPIAGARVSCTKISEPNTTLDEYLSGWKTNWQDTITSVHQQLSCSLDAITGKVTTDSNGKFFLRGIGGDRIVHVKISGSEMAIATADVITRQAFDPQSYNEAAAVEDSSFMRELNPAPVLYGPQLSIIAEPPVTIEGIVKDGVTGKPLQGCLVSTSFGFGEDVTAKSDADGKYRLDGLPVKKLGFIVHSDVVQAALTSDQSTYCSRSVRVSDVPVSGLVRRDIDMHQGALVTGRVIDMQTGEGVVAGIRFAPLPENKYFASKPGFDNYRTDHTMAETNADGRFRLVTIPGKALMMAQVHGGGKFHGEHLCPYRGAIPDQTDQELFRYDKDDETWTITTAGGNLEFLNTENAVKIIDIKEEGETTVELVVDRGLTGTLVLEDADGIPLKDAWVAGLTEHWPITYKVPDSQATVYALDPEKPRALAIFQVARNIGGAVTMRGNEKEPVVAKLGPLGTVTGRLLGADGNAMAKVNVSVNPTTEIGSELYRFAPNLDKPVITDAEGRFSLRGVMPEMKFYLQIKQGHEYFSGDPKIGQLQLKSGETLDLGDRTMVVRK